MDCTTISCLAKTGLLVEDCRGVERRLAMAKGKSNGVRKEKLELKLLTMREKFIRF